MIDANETRRQKARMMRYKKPIVKDLNLMAIREKLFDIQEECESVHWYVDTDDETLIDASRQCFRIYQSFISLTYRYDCIKAAMDILKDENTGYIQMVKQIEETYEKADRESHGFRYSFKEEVKELDRLAKSMPQEAWIQ